MMSATKHWQMNGIATVLALIALGSPAYADTDVSQPAPESTSTLDGGAIEIEYPYWQPPNHGTPKGLVAKYTWKSQPERTVTATLDKAKGPQDPKQWVWSLVFPDQPTPNEVAKLYLSWIFELTQEEKGEINAATRRVVETVISAVNQAYASTPPANASQDFERQIVTLLKSEDLATLRKFANASGQDGLSILKNKLGFVSGADGGWQLTETTLKLLVSLSALQVGTGDASAKSLADLVLELNHTTPGAAEQDCKKEIDVSPVTEDSAGQSISTCIAALAARLDALSETSGEQSKAKLAEYAKKLREVEAKRKPKNEPFDFQIAAILEGNQTIANWYAYRAARLAIVRLNLERHNRLLKEAIVKLSSDISRSVLETSRIEPGWAFVHGGQAPRRYDIATGAIYVGGIEDIVVPTMISICAWEGCLKPNEVAWNAPHGWGRSFSVDAGIRMKTLDTQDPRQSDKLSFVGGLSWNPVTVLRLSTGLYTFENAETKHWNAQPYVGITFNVLNAAELLGGLGLGSQFEPTAEKAK